MEKLSVLMELTSHTFTLFFKKLFGGEAMKVLISSTIELIDFVPSDF